MAQYLEQVYTITGIPIIQCINTMIYLITMSAYLKYHYFVNHGGIIMTDIKLVDVTIHIDKDTDTDTR